MMKIFLGIDDKNSAQKAEKKQKRPRKISVFFKLFNIKSLNISF